MSVLMAGAARREPLTFLELPEDLQTRILAGLSTEQRLNCIPLVCKQLAELASRPGDLWADIRLSGKGRGDGSQDALQPLLKCLRARGALTQSLDLADLAFCGGLKLLAPLFPFLEKLSVRAGKSTNEYALATVQQACKRLNSLRIDKLAVRDEVLGSFLASYSLTYLRLHIWLEGGVGLPHVFTALQSQVKLEVLKLELGQAVKFPPSLPPCLPSLKSLRYKNRYSKFLDLPSTVSCLQHLRRLSFSPRSWSAVFPLVANITGLVSLELEVNEESSGELVHDLNKLSSLTRLHVSGIGDPNEEQVLCADIILPKLRRLELRYSALAAWVDFSSLTGLTSLALEGEFSPVLFSWPFVTQLQSLSISECGLGSFAPLEAAQQLTKLSLQVIHSLELDVEAVGVLCCLAKLQSLKICQCDFPEYNGFLDADDRTLHCLKRLSVVLPAYELCEECKEAMQRPLEEEEEERGGGGGEEEEEESEDQD